MKKLGKGAGKAAVPSDKDDPMKATGPMQKTDAKKPNKAAKLEGGKGKFGSAGKKNW